LARPRRRLKQICHRERSGVEFCGSATDEVKKSTGSGKDRIDLSPSVPGHTIGDTFVVYPTLRVLQTGDMFA
jgi:hypothetical protein